MLRVSLVSRIVTRGSIALVFSLALVRSLAVVQWLAIAVRLALDGRSVELQLQGELQPI